MKRQGVKTQTVKRLLSLTMTVVVAAGVVSPALGARPKQRGSFTATGLPYPAADPGGGQPAREECVQGIFIGEGSRKTLTARRRGVLTATMSGFEGDWDLYVLYPSGQVIVGSIQNQLVEAAPPEEKVVVPLRRGETVDIVPCNWLGGAQATVEYALD